MAQAPFFRPATQVCSVTVDPGVVSRKTSEPILAEWGGSSIELGSDGSGTRAAPPRGIFK